MAIHRYSGQLNPAVSAALFAAGTQGALQTVLNILAQCGGALAATGLTYVFAPSEYARALLHNRLAPGTRHSSAAVGEMVMTALLVLTALVVTGRRATKGMRNAAPTAIGLCVFLAHAALIPVDGTSINPARFLGPAVFIGVWDDSAVMVGAPMAGAAVAVVVYRLLTAPWFHALCFDHERRLAWRAVAGSSATGEDFPRQRDAPQPSCASMVAVDVV